MNRDDLKEFLEIIKINEISQKSWSCKLDFYFHFKINEKAETHRTAKQDRATLNNFFLISLKINLSNIAKYKYFKLIFMSLIIKIELTEIIM